VFEQERLSYDPSRATRAEEFGEGNEQMDPQDQHIAHERKNYHVCRSTQN
jgi:hypothetical protein